MGPRCGFYGNAGILAVFCGPSPSDQRNRNEPDSPKLRDILSVSYDLYSLGGSGSMRWLNLEGIRKLCWMGPMGRPAGSCGSMGLSETHGLTGLRCSNVDVALVKARACRLVVGEVADDVADALADVGLRRGVNPDGRSVLEEVVARGARAERAHTGRSSRARPESQKTLYDHDREKQNSALGAGSGDPLDAAPRPDTRHASWRQCFGTARVTAWAVDVENISSSTNG